jgi:hypothetical protein
MMTPEEFTQNIEALRGKLADAWVDLADLESHLQELEGRGRNETGYSSDCSGFQQ